MEGFFLRKKFSFWLFILFICGLFFIGLYFFVGITDPTVNGEQITFLIMGILITLTVIWSWLFNFGAYVRVDDESIKAKYRWFGKIDCRLSDVDFAVARANTLIIRLKNGKTHTIVGIGNSWQVCSAILLRINLDTTEPIEVLTERLNRLKADKKKNTIFDWITVALFFVNIFATAFLTGERELNEFTNTDWIIMAVMGAIEIATVIAAFRFVRRAGKNNISMDKLQYEIRRRKIETIPLPPGNPIRVYADSNFLGRVIIYGYPNDNSVYYVLQEFAPNYDIANVYESEIYESIERLSEDLKNFIDITETVL